MYKTWKAEIELLRCEFLKVQGNLCSDAGDGSSIDADADVAEWATSERLNRLSIARKLAYKSTYWSVGFHVTSGGGGGSGAAGANGAKSSSTLCHDKSEFTILSSHLF